jgi:hypothetical protein
MNAEYLMELMAEKPKNSEKTSARGILSTKRHILSVSEAKPGNYGG